ncbi:GGDEF domain-containing protein [Shewanella sedimentimangrovi]|uniref:diguanylate cyclase n=1 Tax=Shewanella sedimentimangrovi TaxID=2814293 RepID=A0ABX7R5M8_9GAMM|nr:GGDEF domain-containing protein [Shewanella sedimentimangrovi]QSX38398.1 GGDEF domain-containing protein [Shewanella sedimentimangrovi]
MTQSILHWISESITRKIGGLSTLLLSFIFVVIVYSIVKLTQIGAEMREVAEIDIPLTEVIAEIEVLQLQKHILFEKLRLGRDAQLAAAVIKPQLAAFMDHGVQLSRQVEKAEQLIHRGLSTAQIAEEVAEHKRVLSAIEHFQILRQEYLQKAGELFNKPEAETAAANWLRLETLDEQLDSLAERLLLDIEALTEDIAKNAERHEQEFFIVNTSLGVSAFLIGIYVTWYIIRSFRRRLGYIQTQIARLNQSLAPAPKEPGEDEPQRGQDELSELARDVQQVVERFSSEMVNRHEMEKQLIQLATTDKLTGAFNRHKWEDCLAMELEYGRRGVPVHLLMLDLDHFKAINDNHGHDVGDQVLQQAVKLLKEHVRQSDSLFRLGGEEFALLFRQHDSQDVLAIAEKIRLLFETDKVPGLPYFTASLGLTRFLPQDDRESFIKRADQALYRSKQDGRNRVTVL